MTTERPAEPATGPEAVTFEHLLAALKALADESRLRMVGLLMERPRQVKALAEALSLREPTVCHHLDRLAAAGLVERPSPEAPDGYRLHPRALRRIGRALADGRRVLTTLAPDPEAWSSRVLSNYLDGATLKTIPASRRKRWAVLRWLTEQFAPGQRYREAEVNAILKRHHEDAATLRRELVGYRMLNREQGTYWRQPESEWLQA